MHQIMEKLGSILRIIVVSFSYVNVIASIVINDWYAAMGWFGALWFAGCFIWEEIRYKNLEKEIRDEINKRIEVETYLIRSDDLGD